MGRRLCFRGLEDEQTLGENCSTCVKEGKVSTVQLDHEFCVNETACWSPLTRDSVREFQCTRPFQALLYLCDILDSIFDGFIVFDGCLPHGVFARFCFARRERDDGITTLFANIPFTEEEHMPAHF